MRQRNLDGRCSAQRGRNARHDFNSHVRLAQRFDFLAAATEDERIAALEAHHALARHGGLNHAAVDFVLRHRMLALGLADMDDLGGGRDQLHDAFADQPVSKHDFRRSDFTRSANRQQVGIARPCADQDDMPPRSWASRNIRGSGRAGHLFAL